jgi:hypothetical protein
VAIPPRRGVKSSLGVESDDGDAPVQVGGAVGGDSLEAFHGSLAYAGGS